MPNRPLFSILHTSARPDVWAKVYHDWISKAVYPENVEYVLCVDERWGFDTEKFWGAEFPKDGVRHVICWNYGRKCYVDGVNTAAAASSGSILIVNADDQFAEEGWDEKLSREVEFSPLGHGGNGDFVVSISTGTPREHEREIMVMPILSRARYERLGYVFFPLYESMFADNDFAAHAKQDGVIIDARHLMFPHRHPLHDGSVEVDDAYRVQNRMEAYALGGNLFKRRMASGFGRDPLPESRELAICVSGESFSMTWVLAFIGLVTELRGRGWNVVVHSAYTSVVHISRMMNVRSIHDSLQQGFARPDLALWIDDDNIVNYKDVERLIEDLKTHPDVALAAGWCWIVSEMDNSVRVSCGNLSPDQVHLTNFENVEWLRSRFPRPIEWTGFPCVLMRYGMLETLGEKAFLPVIDNRLMFGMAGEDASFCKRALDAGFKMLADPLVKVQHVKPRAIEPIFTDADFPKPKVAAMMRVKNEGRWIGRVIDSLRDLCGSNVYVMDDGSTDDTRKIVEGRGAYLVRTPFDGQPLNEARDKEWLTSAVVRDCEPDWILCIDGDEELEPMGAEKIFSVIRRPEALDCYAVKFLYLWDRPDQWRCDRWYSDFSRQSLFRVTALQKGLGFMSLYAESGVDCHSGLHVSNAPGGLETGVLQVYLLHYGYMLREDRIRKYEYYNRIDPNNPLEDCYRHIVQGDIPEVPAAAVLKHAGPLELRTLPASIAPKFGLADFLPASFFVSPAVEEKKELTNAD